MDSNAQNTYNRYLRVQKMWCAETLILFILKGSTQASLKQMVECRVMHEQVKLEITSECLLSQHEAHLIENLDDFLHSLIEVQHAVERFNKTHPQP